MRNNIFYHLAPVFRVTLFIFLCFVCLVPFALIANSPFLPFAPSKLWADISVELSLVIVVFSALLMMFRILPYLDFYAVFLRKVNALSGFFKGVGLGVAFMLLCAVVLYLTGNVNFSVSAFSLASILLYLFFFLSVACFEEILFRTYPLFAFAERYPLWFACFFNGVLFALAHVGNDDFTMLGMLNITLAGILFCIYTLQKQNVAWALGLHFSWNVTQGIILGYNVSGNEMPGMVKAVPVGNTYLSGGGFGIEGSVVCTLFLVAWIWWRLHKFGFGKLEIVDPQVIYNNQND